MNYTLRYFFRYLSLPTYGIIFKVEFTKETNWTKYLFGNKCCKISIT